MKIIFRIGTIKFFKFFKFFRFFRILTTSEPIFHLLLPRPSPIFPAHTVIFSSNTEFYRQFYRIFNLNFHPLLPRPPRIFASFTVISQILLTIFRSELGFCHIFASSGASDFQLLLEILVILQNFKHSHPTTFFKILVIWGHFSQGLLTFSQLTARLFR